MVIWNTNLSKEKKPQTARNQQNQPRFAEKHLQICIGLHQK